MEREPAIDDATNLLVSTLEEICIELGILPLQEKDENLKIPKHRQKLFKKRMHLAKRLKSLDSQTSIYLDICKKIEAINASLQSSLDNEQLSKESKVVQAVKLNPKAFYSYANSKRKARPPIGPFLVENELVSCPIELADILGEQFVSVFSSPTQVVPNVPFLRDHLCDTNSFDDLQVNDQDILKAISSLKNSTSPGPDGVTVQFLKRTSLTIAPLISYLMNRSLTEGKVPAILKKAHVVPIYKGGDRSHPFNYRPISLTSTIAKVMEKIVKLHLVEYLETKDSIPDQQHGFRSNFSTVTQLIQHFDDIIEGLEHNDCVDIIYLDFAKAFDKVDHTLLLKSLAEVGVIGKVLSWIKEFLTNRTQNVKIEGYLSQTKQVLSGVPQGSILGPILFVVFIAPLLKLPLKSSISSYADDTKLVCGRNFLGTNDLQVDLQLIYDWVEARNMQLNGEKFRSMTFDPSGADRPTYLNNDGHPIISVSAIKNLGVIIQENGKFEEHVQTKVTKAFQTCGWIYRTFKSRDPLTMKTLYKSIVQPHLEYASPIWAPVSAALLNKIERVLRSFTRCISGVSHLSYWDRLKSLGLYSVQRRYERYQILYVFKCLHGLCPNPGIRHTWSDRRGISCDVRSPPKISDRKLLKCLKNSFVLNKAPVLYNLLPGSLRKFYVLDDPLSSFKRQLDDFLKTIPDQPYVQGYTRAANSNTLNDQISYRV